MDSTISLPLAGLKVIEFTHMVMGPTAGVILADLGADVVKIEPIGGDNTRRLQGSGAGYFPMYNRNKQSLCLDMKTAEGLAVAKRLTAGADIVIENFRTGAMDKLGLGYADLCPDNPALIYCSLKGFLSGPYEHRTALDEVTQMMGGLAYMTGLPDRPMRAGSSVIDITGGMFGVIAILAAVEQRHRSGQGQHVTSSLFETTAFMVGQHMAQQAVSGEEPPPMSVRRSAWSVYDIFTAGDGTQIFVGIVSDTLWQRFCSEFALDEFLQDPSLAHNNDRIAQRERILAVLESRFGQLSAEDLCERLERAGVPFAPINKPSDLFTDAHLNTGGGLVDITLADGSKTRLPALPVELSGQRMGLRRDLPAAGADTDAVLTAVGYGREEIAALRASGTIPASQ